MNRLVLAVVASTGVLLAAASARAERGAPWEPECVDAKAELAYDLKLARLAVAAPLTAAGMCTLDASQCAPSNPIPTPPDVSPPQAPQALAAGVVPVVRCVKSMRPVTDVTDGARSGVTRDLLRPPR